MTLLTPPATTDAANEPSDDDPILLRWGLALVHQHQAQPGDPSRCSDLQCSPNRGYPCLVRRIAERLAVASTAGWPRCWASRHDAFSCGLSPSTEAVGITASPGFRSGAP